MSDDTGTESVDEAEQLIAQLLEAGYTYDHQPGEETGDEDGGEDDDEAGDTEAETGDGGDNQDDDGATETEAGEQPNPAPPPPDASPGPFDSLTDEEKTQLLKVRSILSDNPDIAEKFNQAVKDKFQPEPDKTLPPEIDPEDETSVRLWEQIQEVKAQNEQARVQSEAREKESAQRLVHNDIAQAVDKFKAAHPNLTDEDINSIRAHTAATVNIPSVMGNFPNDPVEGIVRSMEIGSLTDTATRDKVLGVDPASRQQADDAARQKKLNGLSGSSGSAPRTPGRPKKPGSWNEVSQRLTAELEKLGGV